MKEVFVSIVRLFASLIPSPRYILSLERERDDLKAKVSILEDEKRQFVNGLLSRQGLPQIHIGERKETAKTRLRMAPSQWRRRNEQVDFEKLKLKEQNNAA